MRRTPITSLVATVLLACLAVSCKSTTQESLEAISAPANMTGWKVGEASYEKGKGSLMEWIPEEEELDSWTRIARVQFMEGYKMTPMEVMARLEEKMRDRCPSTFWNVIEEERNSVTYEWRVDGCSGQATQHELARLIRGNDGLHRIAYACRTTEIDQETRAYWLGVFAQAYIAKGDPTKPIVVD